MLFVASPGSKVTRSHFYHRPAWSRETTAEELDRNEKDEFLDWRRKLAEYVNLLHNDMFVQHMYFYRMYRLQEIEGIVLTPFEKNLDFWRQLWRVIERRYLPFALFLTFH